MNLIDPYATHLPALAAAVAASTGPVLELGCGMYSTPLLHSLCIDRPMVSLETNEVWFQKFADFQTENHRILLARSYEEFDELIRGTPWGVAFVDHGPVPRRKLDVAKLTHASYVVVHDTECGDYRYEEALRLFAHRVDCKRLTPWTTVVSNQPLDHLRNNPIFKCTS